MTVYSYNAKQLKNKTGPKKPFLTEKKKNILLVAGAFVALGFMSAVADLSTKQTEKVSPTPVAVAQQVVQPKIDEAEDQRLRKIAQEKADRELREKQEAASPAVDREYEAIAALPLYERQSVCGDRSHPYYSAYKDACAKFYNQF
jgi:hypothetical protein